MVGGKGGGGKGGVVFFGWKSKFTQNSGGVSKKGTKFRPFEG